MKWTKKKKTPKTTEKTMTKKKKTSKDLFY